MIGSASTPTVKIFWDTMVIANWTYPEPIVSAYPEQNNNLLPQLYIKEPVNNTNWSFAFSASYFECNATDDSGLLNISLWLMNTTKTTLVIQESNTSVSQLNMTIAISPGNFDDGRYYWWCNATDKDNAINMSENRTFFADSSPPEFIGIPNNITIYYNYNFSVNFTIVDINQTTGTTGIGINQIRVNDSRFNINSSGGLNNSINLPVGVYYINVSVNDSLNNKNFRIYEVNVTQNNESCNVLFNETSPLSYPNKIKAYSDCTSDFGLYQDGIGIVNNSERDLGAGNYTFTVIRADQFNYTNITDIKYFIISKGNSTVYTYINNSRSNATLSIGNFLWLNSSKIEGDKEFILKLYKNGTLINSTTNNNLSNYTIFSSVGIFNITSYYNDSQNYTSSNETWYVNVTDFIPPNITFYSQIPIDLNVSNILGQSGVNISYNITDESHLNQSTIILHYKANSTLDNIMYYQNGSAVSGYFGLTVYTNVSKTFTWNLPDNYILPGTYNFGEISMENTSHVLTSLANANSMVMVELLNVSNSSEFGFYEIMLNKSVSTGTGANIYYCNSTYSSGTVSTDSNCALIYNLPATTTYNHQHSQYSSHQVIPFPVNITSGKIGNVLITSKSYFISQGTNVGTWSFSYITNTSRTGASRTTINSGVAWTNETYTVDSHLHQFGTNSTFFYYACANDTLGNGNCSAVRSDLLEIFNLPPSSPIVYSPVNDVYSKNILINYSESVSPNNVTISYYNITLLNSDFTFNESIYNNSLNLTYYWNSTTISDGTYIIRIEAVDNNSLSSFGFSENFTIDNTPPVLTNHENLTAFINLPFTHTFLATDPHNVSMYKLNDTTYFSVNATSGVMINSSMLSILIPKYYLTVSINDSLNNTANYDFIITTSISTGGTTGGITPTCLYKKLSYWNPILPWIKQQNCI